MQLSGGNSTCKVVKKIIRSLNRTNRPNRQTCKGSLSIMRCNFRMENPICQIEHNISHSSNRTKGNSSCRVVNKIVHSPNRTNRLNRQTWKGSLSNVKTAGTPDSQEVIYQTVVLPPGCSGLWPTEKWRLLSWPCFRFLFTVLRLLRFFAKFAIFAKIVKIAKIATRLGDFVFSSFWEFCDFCDFSQFSQISQKSFKSQKSQRVWGPCLL